MLVNKMWDKVFQCGLALWLIGEVTTLRVSVVGGVVEYMSDSWYWWCYHTEG